MTRVAAEDTYRSAQADAQNLRKRLTTAPLD